MLHKYQKLSYFPDWCDLNSRDCKRLSEPWQYWVSHTGSLTEQIIQSSDNSALTVHVLREYTASPYQHEWREMAESSVLIREVELRLSGQPVVYARSLIPATLKPLLAGLNNRPLGHILFNRSRLQAQTLKRQFAVIPVYGNKAIARRSIYHYFGSNILISEFFLPEFLSHMK